MTDDTRERLIRLEAEVEHLNKAVAGMARQADVEHLSETVAGMACQVNELHNVMMQAKGARWAILGVAGLAGFLAGKAGAVLTFLGIR